MLLTITQSGINSTTGSFANDQVDASQSLIRDTPAPIPQVPYSDPNIGQYGGLLYLCEASVKPGDIVCSDLTAQGTLGGPQRSVRLLAAQEPGPVLGVVTAKTRDTVAEVVHHGIAPVFGQLQPGQRYFLGPQGGIVPTPLDLKGLLYVHFIGFAVAEDTLLVQPSYPLIKRSVA